MALSTQPYKGARDFYPEDKRLQNYMFEVMRRVAQRFGYEEYDASVLEPIELYLAKTGEEIVREQTYVFEDRGGRTVTLRPEMTPSVSRMVAAKRQELAYPLRWFSIPNLWRYERPQKGRLREHWQLNVDIFGVEGLDAEVEIISVANSVLTEFGATREMFTIKLNSRKLINHIMTDYLNLGEVQSYTLSKLIDRKDKMPTIEFAAEADALFTPTQRDNGATKKLDELMNVRSVDQLPESLKSLSSVTELKMLMDALDNERISNTVFDISLMRGLDYYTDIVFEVYDNHPENNRSMFGGGRYDGLVGLFGVDPVPTVGFGMGDVTLKNFLEGHDLIPELRSPTDLYVIIVGDVANRAKPLIREFREMGLNIGVGPVGEKLDKQIKTASKKGIHYALFVGEKELKDEVYTLKNLISGEEEKKSSARVVSIIKDYRTIEE